MASGLVYWRANLGGYWGTELLKARRTEPGRVSRARGLHVSGPNSRAQAGKIFSFAKTASVWGGPLDANIQPTRGCQQQPARRHVCCHEKKRACGGPAHGLSPSPQASGSGVRRYCTRRPVARHVHFDYVSWSTTPRLRAVPRPRRCVTMPLILDSELGVAATALSAHRPNSPASQGVSASHHQWPQSLLCMSASTARESGSHPRGLTRGHESCTTLSCSTAPGPVQGTALQCRRTATRLCLPRWVCAVEISLAGALQWQLAWAPALLRWHLPAASSTGECALQQVMHLGCCCARPGVCALPRPCACCCREPCSRAGAAPPIGTLGLDLAAPGSASLGLAFTLHTCPWRVEHTGRQAGRLAACAICSLHYPRCPRAGRCAFVCHPPQRCRCP